jgi:hypothetical protein
MGNQAPLRWTHREQSAVGTGAATASTGVPVGLVDALGVATSAAEPARRSRQLQ